MPHTAHRYEVNVRWTGNAGEGTSSYRSYSRDHDVSVAGKATLAGSSDPAFRGDSERWNPEELLVAALSQCHMLAYLHACAVNAVVVTAYEDQAEGSMKMSGNSGAFSEVTLHPRVTVEKPDYWTADTQPMHQPCSRSFRVPPFRFRTRQCSPRPARTVL